MPTGTTRLAAVIGDPIRHSLSPAVFNAAFDFVGLDWVYVAFEVAPDATGAAVEAMRTLGIDGLSVTMPHKTEAVRYLDRLSETAQQLGAVNCIARDGSALVGHNTDGAGFIAALKHDGGFDPVGRSFVVLGAGGAARAVILALSDAGAGEIVVVNRSAERGELAAALGGSVSRLGLPGDVSNADVVVNATSVGMGGDGIPISVEFLRPGQLVVDLVYHPVRTPLLEIAESKGVSTLDGVGMLVRQGAAAFELWTGQSAPVAAMSNAARTALYAGQ